VATFSTLIKSSALGRRHAKGASGNVKDNSSTTATAGSGQGGVGFGIIRRGGPRLRRTGSGERSSATAAVDAACTVTVAFAPGSAGTTNAVLRITPTGTGPAALVALTGIGDRAAAPVGQVCAASITGTNAAAVTVTGAGRLATSLAAYRSCDLTVTFRPTSAQAYSAGLVVGGDRTTVPNTVEAALTRTGR
jgi:hypothetical protein